MFVLVCRTNGCIILVHICIHVNICIDVCYAHVCGCACMILLCACIRARLHIADIQLYMILACMRASIHENMGSAVQVYVLWYGRLRA